MCRYLVISHTILISKIDKSQKQKSRFTVNEKKNPSDSLTKLVGFNDAMNRVLKSGILNCDQANRIGQLDRRVNYLIEYLKNSE